MDKLSRNGHRQRMRTSYIESGFEGMPDHNMLELLLSLVIPQKDVKPLSYDLINTFGSLEQVMNASPKELMQVNGIGECAAVAISLVNDINHRISENKNKEITNLSSSDASMEYFGNILSSLKNERVSFVTLDNSNKIIALHNMPYGSVNTAEVNIRKITELVLRDNACSVIIAHNHPVSSPKPSGKDLSFTLELRDFLNMMNIELVDHIIVGDTLYSMRSDIHYCDYFSPVARKQKVAERKKEYNLKIHMDK